MLAIVSLLRPALVLFFILSVLTGIAYPLAVTSLAQTLFSDAAHGSLLVRDGQALGSALIGQSFNPMGNISVASGSSSTGRCSSGRRA